MSGPCRNARWGRKRPERAVKLKVERRHSWMRNHSSVAGRVTLGCNEQNDPREQEGALEPELSRSEKPCIQTTAVPPLFVPNSYRVRQL